MEKEPDWSTMIDRGKDDQHPRFSTIILAAGASTRMDGEEPKLLLAWGGEKLENTLRIYMDRIGWSLVGFVFVGVLIYKYLL